MFFLRVWSVVAINKLIEENVHLRGAEVHILDIWLPNLENKILIRGYNTQYFDTSRASSGIYQSWLWRLPELTLVATRAGSVGFKSWLWRLQEPALGAIRTGSGGYQSWLCRLPELLGITTKGEQMHSAWTKTLQS